MQYYKNIPNKMQRKTLTERLTNKYQLIVRNEENFADRWSFSFNFAKVLVLLTVLVILFYALVTGLNYIGVYLFSSGSGSTEETRMLVGLAARVDSLEYEMQLKDDYLEGVKRMMEGGVSNPVDTISRPTNKGLSEVVSSEEEQFRSTFEKQHPTPNYDAKEGYTGLYFTAPIVGKVTPIKTGNKVQAVSVVANPKKPVISLDKGIVLFLTTQVDSSVTLVVQHPNGLITSYANMKKTLVKEGDYIEKNREIGAATTQTIRFSMFFNGKALDPTKFIAWLK